MKPPQVVCHPIGLVFPVSGVVGNSGANFSVSFISWSACRKTAVESRVMFSVSAVARKNVGAFHAWTIFFRKRQRERLCLVARGRLNCSEGRRECFRVHPVALEQKQRLPAAAGHHRRGGKMSPFVPVFGAEGTRVPPNHHLRGGFVLPADG